MMHERSKTVAALTLALIAVVGCTQAYMQSAGLAEGNRRSIDFVLPVAPDVAQQRVQSAALDSGFTISHTSPGVVTIGPQSLRFDPNVSVTLRVNMVAVEGGTRVVVSGVATDPFMQQRDTPIAEATTGRNGLKWREVMRLAAAIQAVR